MKTALITGVTGQDGSYLAELLLEKGYEVVGVKRRTSSICTDRIDHIMDHRNFSLVYGSMQDTGRLHYLINEYQPEEVYNLAAQSHVKVSFDVPEETVDTVALGTLRLLEACNMSKIDLRFYQASSSEMFGDNPEHPQNEDTRLMPASPYACAKVFAHHSIRNYRKAYGLHASSGILFNHESPRRGETFVTRKITMAAARIKLGLQHELHLGNLDAKRDWGYAGDYVEAMWLMLQQDEPDDYVIATGETHTVREFLEETFKLAELDIDRYVSIKPRFFRPHEVPLLEGEPIKANQKLKWKPKVNFAELVKIMYEHDLALAENEPVSRKRK
jgi:GDPmannose 4,6-dehydratase|tara:strand:- start:2393 stop:3382 length:990 start_codon:yes stop_codon:yes gene_type:complete